MSKSNRAAIPAVLFLLTSQAGAQNPPPGPEGAAPVPVIRATVDEVALDLVVRDRKGRLVKTLEPGDVEIYEDGVRQQIRSLRLVTGDAAPAPPVSKSQPEQPSSASPIPLRTVNLVCIVFHNLDPSTRKWAVAAAQEYINTQLRPGTWAGVFNLDSRFAPLHPFTTNRDELLQAAANAFNGTSVDITRAADAVLNSTPNLQLYVGYKTGNTGGYNDLSTTGSVSMTAITGADVDNGPGANAQRGDLVIQREQFIGIEGARQMDQIKLMIRQIGTFPGHKTVLLLSPGFTTTGDPNQFEAILNKANLADVSVYAFDANGLSQTSTAQASSMAMQHVAALSKDQGVRSPGQPNGHVPDTSSIGSGGVMMERSRQGNYQYDAVRTSDSQSGLRALSEGTGGFLTANSNDLRKPFQQIGGDVETHYEANYHSSSGRYDGHFRKIEVKLARADLRAESRDGYFAIPDMAGSGTLRPFEIAGLMMLNAPARPHAFEFRSVALQFRPGTSSQSAIVFELPGAALSATPQPAQKKHQLHASLFAVVKDAGGAIVDRFGQDFLYQVPDNQLAGIQAAPIDYRHAFNLPAGHYTVDSVLLDREANRASTSTVEFDSPSAKGVGLSSLILVARADPLTAEPDADDPLQFQGRDLVPILSGSLKASTQPLLYFVVYPDKSIQETARVRVEFFVNGEALAQKQDELPPPDSSGAIPVVVNAVARPGNCEIRITALQGFRTATRSVAYTVEAQ